MRRRATFIRPRRAVDPYWILVACLLAVLFAFGAVGVIGSWPAH